MKKLGGKTRTPLRAKERAAGGENDLSGKEKKVSIGFSCGKGNQKNPGKGARPGGGSEQWLGEGLTDCQVS